MPTNKCIVCLDRSEPYLPGSRIEGTVECHFTEQTTLQRITVQLKCTEFTTWDGFRVTYTGNNYIYVTENELFRSITGSLPPGRYVYPFCFTLPKNIPSSYKGRYGWIAYRIRATVERPMRFDYEDDKLITIVSPIDFNRMSRHLQQISTYSGHDSIDCCCYTGGTLDTVIRLPKIAFVPGEIVPFEVYIDNKSNVNVELLKIKLVRVLTHTISAGSKKSVETITKFCEYSGVAAFSERTYNLELSIPCDAVVPNFEHSVFFDVRYNLLVIAKMEKWYIMNPTKEIPGIQLGHIPVSYGQKNNVRTGKAQLPDGGLVPYIRQLPRALEYSTDKQRPPSISSSSSDGPSPRSNSRILIAFI